MRLTFLVVAAAMVAACGAVDETGSAADAPDTGAMVAPPTGGSGGAGGAMGMAPDGGSMATAGTGGGAGGRGGAGGGQSPDAMPAQMQPDAQPPVTGPPMACNVDRLFTNVCLDMPGVKAPPARVLHKGGYVCDTCATFKVDGMTIDRQYVGCAPQVGVVCVMSCSECQ